MRSKVCGASHTAAQAQYTTSVCLLYAVQAHPNYDAPLLAAVNRETQRDAEMFTRSMADMHTLGVIPNQHTPSGERPAVQPAAPPPRAAAPDDAPADRVAKPERTPEATREASDHPDKPGRKRRLVVRKVKTKNEKGYTVTRDVEEYETCSEDEGARAPASEAPAAPKPAAQAPKRAAKPKGKPAQQPSLTSFFTKR